MDKLQYVRRIVKTRRNSFWENIADESNDVISTSPEEIATHILDNMAGLDKTAALGG